MTNSSSSIGLLLTTFRSFEYLAACQAMEGTPVPGKHSFTSALIHALEYLVEHKAEGRFTTVELLRRIKLHSPDFSPDQIPVLSDREDLGPAGRIMLHPLQSHGPKAQFSRPESAPLEEAKRQTVTLHFDFGEKPSVEDIETLGMGLNRVFEQNLLSVHGVRWGGLKPSMTVRVVQRLLEGRQRRASMRRERESMILDDIEDWSTQITSGPLTPSSSSPHSPRIHELVIERDVTIDPSHLSPTATIWGSDSTDHPAQSRNKRRKTSTRGHNIR